MNIAPLLVHRAQIKRQSAQNDGWGRPTLTSAVTISCFCQGTKARIVGNNGEALQVDFELWTTAATSIVVNDQVLTVVTPSGNTLLATGRVVKTAVLSHPTLGEQATQAMIVRN